MKTELKNMNSFRFLQRGIEAELERQRELIGAGGTVEQETLHFDPTSGELTSLRSKEEAHDYRYFPEPDLVAIVPTEAMLAEARESLPELPAARQARYESELGLDAAQARLLAGDPELAEYFEAVLGRGRRRRRAQRRRQLGDRRPDRRAARLRRTRNGPTRARSPT